MKQKSKAILFRFDDNEEIETSAAPKNKYATELPSPALLNKIAKEFYEKNYGYTPDQEYRNNQEDFYNVDVNVLAEYFTLIHKNTANIPIWESKVAYKDTIIADFSKGDHNIASSKLKNNIIPRTTIGHAQSGHVAFANVGIFPNTTLEDVIADDVITKLTDNHGQKIYKSSEHYLKESHELSMEIARMFEKALNSYEEFFYLVDNKGQPLFGIELFKTMKLSTQAFLKGGFFGGMFDNYNDIRINSEKLVWGANYGGGEAYLLNLNLVKEYGIDLDEFTEQNYKDHLLKFYTSHERRLEMFQKLGILLENKKINYSKYSTWENLIKAEGIDMTSPEIKNKFVEQYVRIAKGRGGSDDILIGLASLIDIDKDPKYLTPEYIFAKRLGAQLVDTLDTIEKSTTYFLPGGHDEGLVRFLEQKWIQKAKTDKEYREVHNIDIENLDKTEFVLVDKPQIIRLTTLGINPPEGDIHSSTRYFLKVQNLESMKTYALEQEMLYLQDKLIRTQIPMNNEHGEPFIQGKLIKNQDDFKMTYTKIKFSFFRQHFDNKFDIGFDMYKQPEWERDEFLMNALKHKKDLKVLK